MIWHIFLVSCRSEPSCVRTTKLKSCCSQVLEKAGEPFTFAGLAKCHGAQVSTASGSAQNGDLGEVMSWFSQR